MKCVNALRKCKKTGLITSNSAELFEDFDNLLGICAHPLVLKYKAEAQNKKPTLIDDTEDDSSDDESVEDDGILDTEHEAALPHQGETTADDCE